MWLYTKKLAYPVDIKKKDLKIANCLLAQYGGANGELGAALQYLNQRFNMPDDKGKALLNDIGTEEMGHAEMIATMAYQLMKDATIDEMKAAGLDGYFTDHGTSPFPQNPAGIPFKCDYISTTSDHIADLESDMAAEQRARATYEHLIDLTDDNDVLDPLYFLRQREIVHYQRFKELRNYYLDKKIQKNS